MLRTPLRRSEWLSEVAGADVFLKLETLQPTFSYKIRGAFNAVLRLVEQVNPGRTSDLDTSVFYAICAGLNPELDPGVTASAWRTRLPALVTASAGNHGRAMAYAARALGLGLTVYVPASAPKVKLEAMRQLGADLQTCADYDEAERRAKEHGRSGTTLFVSPYSHPDVIAGAGTVGLEIFEDQPEIDTVLVPMGGGGLISGIATIAADRGGCRVIGVEVEASSPFTQSLAAGRIVAIDVSPTLADGLAGNLDPETVTFDMVRTLVSTVAVVGEDRLRAAIAGIAHEERLIAEGAGATAVAALLDQQVDVGGRSVAVILSGANIDADKLRGII